MDNYEALLSTEMAVDTTKPLKVSELVSLLKNDVEEKHRFVRVIGEISSFKEWRSGHCYFDIKDEQALLPAVMFRPHFSRLAFKVADGLSVLFSGRISIYQANARLQMIVEDMEPLGHGALALAFEQMKEKLKAMGLFDPSHKKPIKPFNQCVGIVTSSHGAVLRDMVRILKARMPNVNILFSPVRVQGAGANLEIKTAIELLDQTSACDVIIVGRGGGSLEDLMAFNDEIVAHAIFNAKTPIISAVGHETDTTISDFVADIRAATPTHAATLAVADIKDIVTNLANASKHLTLKHEARLRKASLALSFEKRRLQDPRVGLFRHAQQLDEMSKKLIQNYAHYLRKQQAMLADLKAVLQLLAPFRQLRLKRDALLFEQRTLRELCPSVRLQKAARDLSDLSRTIHETQVQRLKQHRLDFLNALTRLDALSPLKVLSRGYSVIVDDNNKILNKRSQFARDQSIAIRVEDGTVRALVTNVEQ